MNITVYIMALGFMFLGLQLQLAYSSPSTNLSEIDQNQILCEELAMLNEMVPPDTEVLAETAAGNSVSQRECGFDPNVDPEALTEAQNKLNQSNRD
jgi:hypothetical protein